MVTPAFLVQMGFSFVAFGKKEIIFLTATTLSK